MADRKTGERPALAVLCLGVALVLADVGIKMKSMKADKRNPDLAKFTGSCDYGMEDIDFEGNLEPEIVNITVEFDREVQGFKAKGVKIVEEDGTRFQLTNAKPIKNNKFAVAFSVTFNMTDGDCYSLGGSCSDIEVIGD